MAGILRLSSKRLSSKNKHGFVAISSRSSCHPAEIWMNVEPIKDRQRFALKLAPFLDLTPFFIDGVDFVADEFGS